MNKTTPIEYWRTHDGRKAAVFPEFSTSKTTKGFIVGDNHLFWFPHIWERQSECTKEVFRTDLLAPWTEELDFDASCLPKWAGWIAMSDNLEWHWFQYKPNPGYIPEWLSIPQSGRIPKEHAPTTLNMNWRDSLHQIVNGKAIKA